MISEGLSFELLAWCLSALALAFGAGLGLRALFDPHWARKLVRLQADEQGGGFAEFRATYGGMFLGVHAVAFVFSLLWIMGGELVVGAVAAGASACAAAGWAGASVGRVAAMIRDDAATPFNRMSAALEAVVALLIAAPWLIWSLR
jgi:hypothetical protein